MVPAAITQRQREHGVVESGRLDERRHGAARDRGPMPRHPSQAPDGQTADPAGDARLAPDVVGVAGAASRRNGPILVTGGTGFLGRWVVAALLEQAEVSVVALTRASTDAAAEARVRSALQETGAWRPDWEGRLLGRAGDLTRPGLGLAPGDYGRLSDTVARAVHCAAEVNGVFPYSALRGVNVLGTVEMLRLAARSPGMHLQFVSSTAAVVRNGRALSEDDALGDTPPTEGYGLTKWVAERLVDQAAERGVRVTTHRVGALSGDCLAGRSNPRDYRWLVVKASIALRRAPFLDQTFRWLCVDHVAAAIAHLTLLDRPARRYHLTEVESLSWSLTFAWARRWGYSLAVCGPARWMALLSSAAEPELQALSTIGLPAEAPAGRAEAIDGSRTATVLDTGGRRLRGVTQTLFQLYLAEAVRRGELPAADRGRGA
jgi:thioester reductase-like protein